MEGLGIECIICTGYLREPEILYNGKANHSWNLVKLGDYFYAVDCTRASKLLKAGSGDDHAINYSVRKRFYFFLEPEFLINTHFPEENYYSLLPNYAFSYEYLIS